MQIRAEQPGDRDAVFRLNSAAFGTETEARLVDRLREQARPLISLLATEGVAIAGHIMFTPVTLVEYPQTAMMGLAPMAVVAGRQRRGLGTALVETGLTACVGHGVAAVVVLGHPDYYPRFGFEPASVMGLRSEYDAPDEVFMVKELCRGALDGKAGTVRYHAAFSEAGTG